ncbi:MAG: PAS domain S-box protein, partial [Deltaproteobacteria bacterium]
MDELAKRCEAVCRVLVDESPVVTLLVNDKFEILEARGPVEDVLGMDAAELSGRGLASLRPKEVPPHVSPIGPTHLSGKGFWSEVAVGRADGGSRVVSLEVLPLDDNLLIVRMS